MSDLTPAPELEKLRYIHLHEALNEEERNRVQQIKTDSAARGALQSGGTNRAITDARVQKVRALIDERISIRKTLAAEVPAIASGQL
jgi:hypothetical protein